jgi:hypothetical protein
VSNIDLKMREARIGRKRRKRKKSAANARRSIYYVNAIITYALSDDFLIFSLSLFLLTLSAFSSSIPSSSSSSHKYVDI